MADIFISYSRKVGLDRALLRVLGQAVSVKRVYRRRIDDSRRLWRSRRTRGLDRAFVLGCVMSADAVGLAETSDWILPCQMCSFLTHEGTWSSWSS